MIKSFFESFRKKKQMLPEEEKNQQENTRDQAADTTVAQEPKEQVQEEDELSKAKKEIEELKDKYLRLYSEFDNFRRRTAKEKMDLMKSANEDVENSIRFRKCQ